MGVVMEIENGKLKTEKRRVRGGLSCFFNFQFSIFNSSASRP
jgi:hypothetical protein